MVVNDCFLWYLYNIFNELNDSRRKWGDRRCRSFLIRLSRGRGRTTTTIQEQNGPCNRKFSSRGLSMNLWRSRSQCAMMMMIRTCHGGIQRSALGSGSKIILRPNRRGSVRGSDPATCHQWAFTQKFHTERRNSQEYRYSARWERHFRHQESWKSQLWISQWSISRSMWSNKIVHPSTSKNFCKVPWLSGEVGRI